MKGDKKIIDILNDLLAGELTAVDQYLIHAEMYADMGLNQLAEKSIHESDHERQHARAIIQRILFLEGKPDLSKREGLKIGDGVVTAGKIALRDGTAIEAVGQAPAKATAAKVEADAAGKKQ